MGKALMEFEQQKPITDEYRRGWERIYTQQEARKAQRGTSVDTYLNGCPILSEGPQKDDL
jgi:hypothetical protein